MDYELQCEKCGFKFMTMHGVGMMFPLAYVKTVQKAKSGELGAEMKEFFEEHPDGAIDSETVTLCCDNCGHLSINQDLTMYVLKEGAPKKTEHGRWCVGMGFEDVDYVDDSDLEQNYKEYKKYTHRCTECGGNMHVVKEHENYCVPTVKSQWIQ